MSATWKKKWTKTYIPISKQLEPPFRLSWWCGMWTWVCMFASEWWGMTREGLRIIEKPKIYQLHEKRNRQELTYDLSCHFNSFGLSWWCGMHDSGPSVCWQVMRDDMHSVTWQKKQRKTYIWAQRTWVVVWAVLWWWDMLDFKLHFKNDTTEKRRLVCPYLQ